MKLPTGFSLIELMVGMMLALFVLAGLLTLVQVGRDAQNVQNQHAQIQENARLAIELLLRDLRMAGYFGCASDPAKTHSRLTHAAGSLTDINNGLEGFEQTQTSWSPSGSVDKVDEIMTQSDAVTVRFANPSARSELSASMTAPDSGIPEPGNTDWRADDILVVSDCDSADVFRVDSISSNRLISDKLGKAYQAGSELTSLWAVRYFVAPSNTNGFPTLKRQLLQGRGNITTEELAQGVENLQFLFGEDANQDGVPDTYRQAHQVVNWKRVVMVQVGMLLRSLDEFGEGPEPDESTYKILDHQFSDPHRLRVRRRVLQYSVALRNTNTGDRKF